MKLKHLWPFMLVMTIIGGGVKIGDTICTLNGNEFFIDSSYCNIIFIGAIVLCLIVGYIMSFIDRKKTFDIEPQKNTFGGFFGFITSVALIGGAVISLLGLGSSKSFSADLIYCLLTLFGGGVLLFQSCVLFTGSNSMKKVPILALAVPLWGCARLISLFMEYTKVSIQCTEMFDIISVVLLLMFLFYQSTFFANINKDVAVRKMIVYGVTFVMSTVIVTADLIIKKVFANELTVSNVLTYVSDIAFCGYALCLMASILKSAKVYDENDDDEDFSDDEPKNVKKSKLIEDDMADGEKSEPIAKKLIIEEKPEPTEKPVVEKKPEPTEKPVVEKKPEPTEKPVVENKSEPTENPVIEKKPEPTEKPVVEKKPEPTEKPVVEKKPEPTENPVVEKKPEPTEKPVVENKSEPTENPTVENKPEPTAKSSNIEKTEPISKGDSAYDEIFKLLDEMSSKK